MPQQPQHLKWVLAICVFAIVALPFVVNGMFMLVSPRAWYRLPHWFRASSGLSEQKYGRGWGAVQVRLVGATYLAVAVWVLYDIISKHL